MRTRCWTVCVQILPLLSTVTLAQPVAVTEDDVVIDPAALVVPAGAPALAQIPGQIQFRQTQFDNLTRGANNLADPHHRAQLEGAMMRYLRVVDQQCHLTAEQFAKLSLAIEMDSDRLADDCKRLQAKYVDRMLLREDGIAAYGEILRRITIPAAHPCGEHSLFFKVFRRRATPAQWEKFVEIDRSERVVEARKQFTSLITSGRPPTDQQLDDVLSVCFAKYPRWQPMPATNTYGQYVINLIAHELKDEIKPLLTADQRLTFEKRMELAPRLEPIARQMGLWPIPSE